MKTIISILFMLCMTLSFVGAQSFLNNEYQQRATHYEERSQYAFDSGDYDAAIEYSLLAEENAELSLIYINNMLAKYNASTGITYARNRLLYVEGLQAPIYFPTEYETGKQALSEAVLAYDMQNWATARLYADESIEALKHIQEVASLPQYYVVTPWSSSQDCYWDIAGRPYVYNNPYLWQKLYEANKHNMEDPNNPNLIHPDMKIEIPSLDGEIRQGQYTPGAQYGTYGE